MVLSDGSSVLEDDPAPSVRQTTAAMRMLFLVAAVLVALAGMQLFILARRTDRYFSWTIGIPLTAAFLGAGYWASVPLEWLSGRERVWARCRPAVSGVFVFTVLTLLATALHIDLFHIGDEFALGTQVVTWAWIVVYVVVPVMFMLILRDQLRQPGGDPPRVLPFPSWMRVAVCAQAAVMLVLGAALFIAPERVSSWWPWPLTPLTGRAVAAWLVALGVIALQVVWENDFTRTRPVWISNVVLIILQVIALLRYSDSLDWSPEGQIYLLFLISLFLIGSYGVLRGYNGPMGRATHGRHKHGPRRRQE